MGKLNKISQTVPQGNQIPYQSLATILSLDVPQTKKLELISYNISRLDKGELLEYILTQVIPSLRDNYDKYRPERSAQSRLLLAYDLLENGDL